MEIKIERFFLSKNELLTKVIPFQHVTSVYKYEKEMFVSIGESEDPIVMKSDDKDYDRFYNEYLEWLRYGR